MILNSWDHAVLLLPLYWIWIDFPNDKSNMALMMIMIMLLHVGLFQTISGISPSALCKHQHLLESARLSGFHIPFKALVSPTLIQCLHVRID